MKIDFYLDQDVDTMFPDQVRACQNRFYNQKYQKHHHVLCPAQGEDFEIFLYMKSRAKIDLLFIYKISHKYFSAARFTKRR